MQETEAAVDATIQKVLAAVDPLESAWQAELQRLQVGGQSSLGGVLAALLAYWVTATVAMMLHGYQQHPSRDGWQKSIKSDRTVTLCPPWLRQPAMMGFYDRFQIKPSSRGSWTHHTLHCVVGCFRPTHFPHGMPHHATLQDPTS